VAGTHRTKQPKRPLAPSAHEESPPICSSPPLHVAKYMQAYLSFSRQSPRGHDPRFSPTALGRRGNAPSAFSFAPPPIDWPKRAFFVFFHRVVATSSVALLDKPFLLDRWSLVSMARRSTLVFPCGSFLLLIVLWAGTVLAFRVSFPPFSRGARGAPSPLAG